MTGDAFRAIQDRLAGFRESGNAAPLLDAAALDEVADLRRSIGWPAFGPLPDNEDIQRELNPIVLAGTFLWTRAGRLPDADQLEARLEATELLAAAYAIAPATVPRPLASMIAALSDSDRDLDHAVLHDEAVDKLARASRGTELAALDHAIWMLTSAVRAAARDPLRPYYLSDLGTAWLNRFHVTGRAKDLDNSVTVHELALAAGVEEPEDQAGRLSNYSAALLARFGQREDPADLSGALASAREAVRLAGAAPSPGPPDAGAAFGPRPGPPGLAIAAPPAADPTRAERLARLAGLARLSAALLASFERTGDQADLDQAVQASARAASLAPPGDPAHSRYQAALAQARLGRFGHGWSEADLTAALAAAQDAADTAPDRPAARVPALTALARSYCASYAFYGNAHDLDQAISSGRTAVTVGDTAAARRLFTAGRALSLAVLADAMQLRYEHASDADALDDAIILYGQSLQAVPVSQPERRRFLISLGNALRTRFGTAGNASDIGTSVTVLSEAVALARPGEPGRTDAVAALAGALVLAAQAGDPVALDQAITLLQRELGTVGGPERPVVAAALGYAWRARFDAAGDDEPLAAFGTLGSAITAFRQAAAGVPPGHPRHAEYLAGLGSVLRRRFESTGDEPSAREAVTVSAAAAQAVTACPRIRARAAVDWGKVAARQRDAAGALAGLGTAVGLLDLIAGPAAPRDHLDPFGRLTALACDAAAWAITAGYPEQAVELLEHGRGVLLARALDAGARYRDLQRDCPDLAARLAREDQLLACPPAPGAPLQPGDDVVTSWRGQHAAARDALLAEIRAQPGRADFRRPPPFAAAREAAAGGPVVLVNVSAYRCDALIVTPAGVTVTELPALTAAEVSGRATAFIEALLARDTPDLPKRARARVTISQTLAWLETAVISPLRPLLAPATLGEQALRVWWCPTGALTFLPLHAAAALGEPAAPGTPRFVSSYAPTLGLLRRARAGAPPADDGRPLVVALPAGPGLGLRSAMWQEGRAVARQLDGAVTLRGFRATVAAVTERLTAGAPWAHFACRGVQDASDPAAGELALHDGPLRAGAISALALTGAELAVLPAGDIALGGTSLADEAVTLAAAFQRGGFRQVIGTMWRPPDELPPVADQVYDGLGPPGAAMPAAAVALDRAVTELRRAHPDEPWRWAPYIHLGP